MQEFSRRTFLSNGITIGLGLSFLPSTVVGGSLSKSKDLEIKVLKKSATQLFVDDLMIIDSSGMVFKAHKATKLSGPVLSAEKPWERDLVEGEVDKRVYVYGSVLKDVSTGKFRMWYNRGETVMIADSDDGINWTKPILNIKGENNIVNLNMHSPSIIFDRWEIDPNKRYKAVGSAGGHSSEEISNLKQKFHMSDWYHDKYNRLYKAAYSPDGLNWTSYKEPILLSADTVTLAQDQNNGEYLVFHKREGDPRVKGRQIFLSVSADFVKWSEPKLVLETDEIDHVDARKEEDGTHSEFYNMSAFQWGSQWLGLVTQFRVTGTPKVRGPGQSMIDGPVDVQVVTSRDGSSWERCRDRTPVIPIGPDRFDGGTILGVTNTPIIIENEMCMYYAAMTTTHGGAFPQKEFSIGIAKWRVDGMVSIRPENGQGWVETKPFLFDGRDLFINADIQKGRLMIEVLNQRGEVIPGFNKEQSIIENTNDLKIPIRWGKMSLPMTKDPIKFRFYVQNGDIFSYMIK